MFAERFLDKLEEQGLLDEAVVAELRRQVAESSRTVTAEAIAKFLVDNGHLTRYQAVKLIGEVTALGSKEGKNRRRPEAKGKPAAKGETPAAGKGRPAEPELGFAEEEEEEEAEIVSLEETSDAAAGDAAEEPADLVILEDAAPEGGEAAGSEEVVVLEDAGPAPEAPAPLTAEPLQTGLEAEPFGLAAAAPAAPAAPRRSVASSPWDSKLILVGSAVLMLLIIAFVFLYYSLTRGSASEMFQLAEQDYRAQAYTQAIAKYEKFLEKFPRDENASLARVRKGIARLRLAVEGSGDPAKGLEAARTVLPEIENEEAFGEARPELASLLPDIAEGFAQRALDSEDTAEAEKHIGLTEQALELVNNPVYIPTTLRKTQQTKLAAIQETLVQVRRRIERTRELVRAVAAIREAAAAGRTNEAFAIRKQLLDEYPGLATDPQLVEATAAITAKERELVTVGEAPEAEGAPEADLGLERLAIARRSGEPVAGLENAAYCFLARGCVYGVEAASGRVAWRRFVGFESTAQPLAVGEGRATDVVVSDQRRREAARIEGLTGKVAWRTPVGAPFAAAVDQDRLLVSTETGYLMELGLEDGQPRRAARLPQPLRVAVGLGDRQRRQYYQVGEHSHIYVLSRDTLQCGEVFYLAHRAGTVAAAPVMVLGHLLVAENAGDDFCRLHVIATNASGLALKEVQPPLRLQGRVLLPPVVFGRRVLVVTDRGGVYVLEVEPANKPPARVAASVVAATPSPIVSYPVIDGGRLWMADRRFTRFDIQLARGQMVRRWARDDGDAFLAPPRLLGDVILHVRRQRGGAGLTVAAVGAEDGKPVWQTDLASPLPVVQLDEASGRVLVAAAQGAWFSLAADQFSQGVVDQPRARVGEEGEVFNFREPIALGDGRWVLADPERRDRILLVDPGADEPLRLVRLNLVGGDGAWLAGFQGLLAVPMAAGQVRLLDPATGRDAALPFQPPLAAGETVAWGRPAVMRGQLVIAEQGGVVYRLAIQGQPQKRLEQTGRVSAASELAPPLAAAGDVLYAVARGGAGDIVLTFRGDKLAAGEELPLEGRVVWGPAALDDRVLLAADPDGLVCLRDGKLLWRRSEIGGSLAAEPIVWDGDLLLLSPDGGVRRIDGESGELRASLDLGEPAGPGWTAAPAGRFRTEPGLVIGGEGELLWAPVPEQGSP